MEAAIALIAEPGRIDLEQRNEERIDLVLHGDAVAMNRLLAALLERGVRVEEVAPRRAALSEVFHAATRSDP